MNLDSKVEQLTLLVSEMMPVMDALVASQKETDRSFKETDRKFKETDAKIDKLVNIQSKTNMSFGEMRQSNIKLADVIEKLILKIDKIDDFEIRLKAVESKIN